MELLTPLLAAKATTVILLAHGGAHYLNPSGTSKLYGVKDNGMNQVIIRRIGAALLAQAILGWCMIFNDFELFHSVGLSTIPWVVDGIISMSTNEPRRLHFSPVANLLVLGMALGAGYILTSVDSFGWKALAFHLYLLGGVVNVVGLAIVPTFGVDTMWRIKGSDDDTRFLSRACGLTMATGTLMIMLLHLDFEPITALGYGMAAHAVALLVPMLQNQKHGHVEHRHRYMFVAAAALSTLMLAGTAKAPVEEAQE